MGSFPEGLPIHQKNLFQYAIDFIYHSFILRYRSQEGSFNLEERRQHNRLAVRKKVRLKLPDIEDKPCGKFHRAASKSPPNIFCRSNRRSTWKSFWKTPSASSVQGAKCVGSQAPMQTSNTKWASSLWTYRLNLKTASINSVNSRIDQKAWIIQIIRATCISFSTDSNS